MGYRILSEGSIIKLTICEFSFVLLLYMVEVILLYSLVMYLYLALGCHLAYALVISTSWTL